MNRRMRTIIPADGTPSLSDRIPGILRYEIYRTKAFEFCENLLRGLAEEVIEALNPFLSNHLPYIYANMKMPSVARRYHET